MSNIKQYLDKKALELQSILSEVEDEFQKYLNKQSVIDKIIVDIEHEIEFDKLSGAMMMRKYKELQVAFRLRRQYKDGGDYLVKFRQSLNLKSANNVISALNKMEAQKDNRKYSKRIRLETREQVLAEFNKLMEE